MLNASLNHPARSNRKSISSAFFVLLGSLLMDADGKEVARLDRGLWNYHAEGHLFVDFPGEVKVTFENPAILQALDAPQARYESCQVSLIGSSMWTGNPPQLLAEYFQDADKWRIQEPFARFAIDMAKATITADEPSEPAGQFKA